MSKPSFTPGPWAVEKRIKSKYDQNTGEKLPDETTYFIFQDGNKDQSFTLACVNGYCVPEVETNARLIAAAPEMLNQLTEVRKFLLSYMDGDLVSYDRVKDDDTWPHLLLRDIERILAKAEGGAE